MIDLRDQSINWSSDDSISHSIDCLFNHLIDLSYLSIINKNFMTGPEEFEEIRELIILIWSEVVSQEGRA